MKNLVPEHGGVHRGGADVFENTQSHLKASSEHFLDHVWLLRLLLIQEFMYWRCFS